MKIAQGSTALLLLEGDPTPLRSKSCAFPVRCSGSARLSAKVPRLKRSICFRDLGVGFRDDGLRIQVWGLRIGAYNFSNQGFPYKHHGCIGITGLIRGLLQASEIWDD